MRIALLQMTSGVDPVANAATMVAAVAEAAAGGAVMLFTPEMSGLVDRDRARAKASVWLESDDVVLAAVCDAAKAHKVWVHIGSLAVDAGRADDGDVAGGFGHDLTSDAAEKVADAAGLAGSSVPNWFPRTNTRGWKCLAVLAPIAIIVSQFELTIAPTFPSQKRLAGARPSILEAAPSVA